MSLSLEEELIYNYLQIVSVSEVKETENVYREILESSGRRESQALSLDEVLTSINRVIKSYDLEIMEAVDETTKKRVHCLIATKTSSIADKATFYSRHTCEILSKIIHECVLSETGSVTEAFCLSLTNSDAANAMPVQESFERLLKDKWLVCKEGIVSLGSKCAKELGVSIKKQYPGHVKSCALCKMFSLQGFTCPKCDNHVHTHCLRKHWKVNRMLSTSRMCPICKEGTCPMEVEDEEMKSSPVGGEEPPTKKTKTLEPE